MDGRIAERIDKVLDRTSTPRWCTWMISSSEKAADAWDYFCLEKNGNGNSSTRRSEEKGQAFYKLHALDYKFHSPFATGPSPFLHEEYPSLMIDSSISFLAPLYSLPTVH